MVPRLTNNGNSIKHSHFILWVSITLTATHTSTRRSLDIPGGTWMPRREHRGGSSRPWSQWGRREMRFSRSQRGWLHCIRRGSTSSSSCLENKKIHNWQNVISHHVNALLHLLKMSVEVLIKHITTLHIPWTQHTKHHLASISRKYIEANLPMLMKIETDLCYDRHGVLRGVLRDDGDYLRWHPLPGGECGGGQGPLWCDGGHDARGHPFSVQILSEII